MMKEERGRGRRTRVVKLEFVDRVAVVVTQVVVVVVVTEVGVGGPAGEMMKLSLSFKFIVSPADWL